MNLWNVLPAAPWHYPWFPAILAGTCWVFLALLVVFLIVREWEGVLGCLVYIAILRTILLLWSPTATVLVPPIDPMVEWRLRSREAEQVLARLKADRAMLLVRLAQADDRQRRLLASEMDELNDQIAEVEREKGRLDGVVVGMESRERQQERREMILKVLSDKKRDEAIRGELEVGSG